MGFPPHHRFPPNGTLKPRCPPVAGASLIGKAAEDVEQCQVDANSVTESHYPAEFSCFVVSCDPRSRSKSKFVNRSHRAYLKLQARVNHAACGKSPSSSFPAWSQRWYRRLGRPARASRGRYSIPCPTIALPLFVASVQPALIFVPDFLRTRFERAGKATRHGPVTGQGGE